jgi:hypothetical protein
MAITSLSTSSLVSGVKRRRVWDQTATTDGFFQIATTTLNVAASSITFSNIPQDYTHLHIRGIARSTTAASSVNTILRFNSDTGANYASHYLTGNGSSGISGNETSSTYIYTGAVIASTSLANSFEACAINILDYSNTNKFKTVATLSGWDANGSGITGLWSGHWRSTSSVTSIILLPNQNNFAQYSSFALYGIKG